jgi:hypothetical protein
MIVSHARKFIFIHNPKCAGTSFRTAIDVYDDHGLKFWGLFYNPFFMKNLDYAHLRTWEVAAVFPEIMEKFSSYRSIVFVKNPYTRFVSSVREHFLRFRNNKLSDLSAAEQMARVEKFVEQEITLHKVLGDVAYVHFSPQSWFINLGGRRLVTHIIPMRAGTNFIESATGILEIPSLPVERLNRSSLSSEAILQSPKVLSFIKSFYKQDFDLFEQYDHLHGVVEAPDLLPDKMPDLVAG